MADSIRRKLKKPKNEEKSLEKSAKDEIRDGKSDKRFLALYRSDIFSLCEMYFSFKHISESISYDHRKCSLLCGMYNHCPKMVIAIL